uniref:Thyroglobulin type-1 domain-containing protein n=1 Tax=Haplochromis burtoni TaxID=8153 RepID=A0A3Q2WTT6_HAPBU
RLNQCLWLLQNTKFSVTDSPSPCEEERRAAMEANSVFIPSCESGGAFDSKQCQQGGQCWCVDPGREVKGSRTITRRPLPGTVLKALKQQNKRKILTGPEPCSGF